jgi:hypothetical protein
MHKSLSEAAARATVGLLATLALTAPARAETLFPAGPEAKGAGIESSLAARGAPAVLYNPANLAPSGAAAGAGAGAGGNDAAARSEPYAELGLVNVHYSYEHPEFDPVSVSVTSPTVTLGYAARLPHRLTAGLVVFPKKAGKTAIDGLPRKVGGTVIPLDVESDERIIDVGAGLGWQATDTLSLGLAAIHTQETHAVHANLIGNDNDLIDMRYRGAFTRPVLGARFAPARAVTFAAALKGPQKRAYKGSQRTASVPETTSPRVVNYDPTTLSLGAATQLGGFGGGVEVNRQRWSQGRGIVRNGLGADDPDADLRDVTEVSVTGGYGFASGPSVRIGYARLPSPWGDGHDDGDLDSHVSGVDFGQLNGMDRQAFSLGGAWALPLAKGRALDVSTTVLRQQGTREVAGDGDNVGYYSLGVTSVSGAVRASF